MRMGQGIRTGLGHGGITCVLQTQFSRFNWIMQNIHHENITKQKIFPWRRYYLLLLALTTGSDHKIVHKYQADTNFRFAGELPEDQKKKKQVGWMN